MVKHLHIVSFDIPYPANYGGVIDVFYQIKMLHALSVQITLHCFAYGNRTKSTELEKYCTQVIYYPRKSYWQFLFSNTPFIIASRNNKNLLTNLCKDDSPILLEAIHTAGFVNHPILQHRKIVIRTLNVENDYYQQLAINENHFFKKTYYNIEAKRLVNFETTQLKNKTLACIAQQDVDYFSKIYGSKNCHYIGPFHAFTSINISTTTTDYCLYHGTLSVAENEKSALWLMQEVFKNIPTKLIIAGSNPSSNLMNFAASDNVTIIANPTDEQLQQYIQQAQINVLPSFQNTGLKLKLMNALYNGKHCLVNPVMLTGTTLQDVCILADTATEWQQAILQLMQIPFNNSAIENRKNKLASDFSVESNAKKLYHLLFTEI